MKYPSASVRQPLIAGLYYMAGESGGVELSFGRTKRINCVVCEQHKKNLRGAELFNRKVSEPLKC